MVRHQVAGRHDRRRAPMKYMISFALPRFCDQSLDRSRKERFYPGAEPWIAKLDTVVHELYHIDPELAAASAASSARTAPTRPTATASSSSSRSPTWCTTYLDSAAAIRRSTISCAHDFDALDAASRRRRRHELPHVPVVSAALHRARSRMQPPCESDAAGVDDRTAARCTQQPTRYTRATICTSASSSQRRRRARLDSRKARSSRSRR